MFVSYRLWRDRGSDWKMVLADFCGSDADCMPFFTHIAKWSLGGRRASAFKRKCCYTGALSICDLVYCDHGIIS